jgi:hypothetical protein
VTQVASAAQAAGAQETKQQDTNQKQEPKPEGQGEKKEEEPPAAAEAPKAPKGKWHINGEADGYVENNFNDPFNEKNQLRAFDEFDLDNGPQFSYMGLSIVRDRTPIGFRIDPGFGEATRLFNLSEPLPEPWDDAFQYMQQIYASANLNKKGTTYVDIGKWYTPVGLEVFVPRDDWNYSRSLLYNFAEPFYHLGARIYKYKNTTDYWMVNVNRGWNRVGGVPGSDNVGGGVSWGKQVSKKLNAVVNTMVSSEPDFAGISNERYLGDLVLTYVSSPKWTFALNGDYWHQSDFLLSTGGPEVNGNVGGLAGYALHNLNKKSYVALRAEFLDDAEGAAGTGAAQTIWETTLTYAYKLNKYAQVKAEYRHDSSDVPVFFTSDFLAPSHGQDTLGGALILSY